MEACAIEEGSCQPCTDCPNEDFVYVTPLPDNKEAVPDNALPKIGIVTEERVTGRGVFDIYMRAASEQLLKEYKAGRIVGKEYSNAFIAAQELMMTQANQFVLGEYKIAMEGAMIAQQIAELKLKSILERNLLSMQLRSAEIKNAIGEEQLNETIAKKNLICEQQKELGLNGKAERLLKCAQEAVAREQVNLYKAQAKGFQDKNRNDTFKNLMNAWAVHASEVDPDSAHRVNAQLQGMNLTGSVVKAKAAAGL